MSDLVLNTDFYPYIKENKHLTSLFKIIYYYSSDFIPTLDPD